MINFKNKGRPKNNNFFGLRGQNKNHNVKLRIIYNLKEKIIAK